MALRISTGSGATLATDIIDGEHLQRISAVSIYPLPAGTEFIGLVSLSSINGNVNVTNSSIAATQSGTWNMGLTGLISLASGTEIKSLATINNFPASYPVTDNGGSITVDWLSGATVAINSLPSINGNVNVTNSSFAVTQSGNWDIRSVLSVASINGNVNITNTSIPVTGTFWQATQPVSINQVISLASGTNVLTSFSGVISLASGTFVSLNAGTNNIGDVDVLSIAAGDNNIGNVDIVTLPALPASSNFIGLVSTASIQGKVEITNTVPVSGTFWQSTQPVSLNQVISLASGTNVLTSFSGLISLASGTFVSLNSGANHIGSVSVYGNLQSQSSPMSLFPSSSFIGLVSTASIHGSVNVVNTSLAVTQSGTWDEVGINDSGNSLTVDNDGTFAVQAAQSGTWNVGVTGLISLASGTSVLTSFNGLISLASGTFVSLNAGTNNIGDVDVLSIAAGDNNIGNVDIVTLPALPTGTNFIGLVSAASIHGTVLNAAGTNYIGLASVNIGGSLPAGTNNIGDVDILSIAAGDNNIGNIDIVTLPALPTGTNFIGLATVVNGNQPALVASTAYIGLASVNIGGTLPALTTGAAFIGLVSVQGNVNIQSGATVSSLPISSYTSFATVYSASGNATLFVPPASNRWILKDLLIGSQGNQIVSVKSGTQELFPPIALATLGGFVLNNGDSGLRAKAVNEAFVLNLGATATISVLANVRFE